MAEIIQYANGVPGIRWPLDKTIIRIGRSDNNNDIAVDDAFASKVHAQIEIVLSEDQSHVDYFIRDLDSTNHTYLNQSPIEHQQLSHNDTVMIGKSKFVFVCEGVRDFVSPERLLDSSEGDLAKEMDDSLTIAVDEITEEFRRPEPVELVKNVYDSVTGRHKFSRRLNLY